MSIPNLSKSSAPGGWRVVVGAGIGISFGSLPFFATGFAILARAIAAEFGFSQTDVAKAATIFLLSQIIANLLCAAALQRWQSRKVAAASITIFAGSLLALSQIQNSLLQFYVTFAIIGLFGIGTNPIAYAQAIAQWFDRRRGLALGLATGAQSVGLFIFPIFMLVLISRFGWRWALIDLAIFEIVICLPAVILLVRDAPHSPTLQFEPHSAETANSISQERQLTYADILRSVAFWKLVASFAVMGMSIYAIGPNIVYILKDGAGLSLAEIAQVQSISGVAFLIGRVTFGYLLDRTAARIVALLALTLASAHLAIYAYCPTSTMVMIAAVLAGLSSGGESDLMPYVASRYFGARNVSRIYSLFLVAWFVGAAIGPVAFAQLAVASGGSLLPLNLLLASLLLPAAMFLYLGRYPADSASQT
ncbi:MFS transporter [Tardiphaga robiniae]|uniref:MFS transporter n=1 Tax=Tardiphaga robiniae TaxID=943830 RepID=A0A7G6TYY1_9BRAD|nr:MFS transporter [Tardiphaga robiniae]QND71963.1 MFS transporter [Tardiphaga robiniae]